MGQPSVIESVWYKTDMKTLMKHIYYLSMYYIFILVFTHELFGISDGYFMALSTMAIVLFLVSSLILTRGFQLYISLAALFIGHVIVFYYDLNFQVWYIGMTKGIGMPLLFVVIPLISFPIKHGPYLDSLESFAVSKINKPGVLFIVLSLMHLALTIVLNIGSIPTLQKLICKFRFPKQFLSLLYLAGYASYIVFSPFDAVLNMILMLASITYSQYFCGGLVMVISILMVAVVYLRCNRRLRALVLGSLTHLTVKKADPKKVYELFGHIIIMILLAFFSEQFLPFSTSLYGIALVIVFYSFVWGAWIRKLGAYKKELKTYSRNFLAFKGFLPFLISAGFLGSLVPYTRLNDGVALLMQYVNVLPQYMMIQLLILVTMILSLCGVHMLITVTVLAAVIPPSLIGLSPPSFVLLLLSCWFIAMSITPFAPFVVVVADTIEEQPFVVGFKYNIGFSLIMLFVSPLIICVVNYLM